MNVFQLAPAVVVLPLLAAGLAFACSRRPRWQPVISLAAMVVVLALETFLLVASWEHGPVSVSLGGWGAPEGIVMVVDPLSSLLLVVSTVVCLAVLVYALGQGVADGHTEAPVSVFYPTYMMLLAGVSNAFLAGDLFNLYVGFEILLTASYVLLTMSGSASRIRAGITYTVVSVMSSMVFLIAIGMVYAATGTVNMADVAEKAAHLPASTQTMLHLVLLVGFGIKAAVFPLSLWLPDSYPTAPAPVTAVFAGLLTKVGIYAMIRTETLLFPENRLDTLLTWVAVLTLVVGILGAITQTDMKRMLSFVLISHMGYLVWGIALGSQQALASVVFYVLHPIVIQTSLFMVVGLIERRGGSSSMDRVAGMARLSPLLAILYFVPAMNLGGIPPFSGFLGKLGLVEATTDRGTWQSYLLAAVGLFVSLVTLMVLARAWNRVFWRKAADAEDPDPVMASGEGHAGLLPRTMLGATTGLVAVGVALTVFAGPLYGFADRAADQLADRSSYVHAVLDGSGKAHQEGGH